MDRNRGDMTVTVIEVAAEWRTKNVSLLPPSPLQRDAPAMNRACIKGLKTGTMYPGVSLFLFLACARRVWVNGGGRFIGLFRTPRVDNDLGLHSVISAVLLKRKVNTLLHLCDIRDTFLPKSSVRDLRWESCKFFDISAERKFVFETGRKKSQGEDSALFVES